MLCCALLYVLASCAIILMGMRELVALLCFFLVSCDFYCSVASPGGVVGCLQCVIVILTCFLTIVKMIKFKDIPNLNYYGNPMIIPVEYFYLKAAYPNHFVSLQEISMSINHKYMRL